MRKIADRYCAVVGCIVSILIFFMKWITYQGTSYTIIEFYSTVHSYGGIGNFSLQTEALANPDKSIVPAFLFLALPLAVGVIFIIRTFLVVIGKNIIVLSKVAYGISFIYILTTEMCDYAPCAALIISIFLVLADGLGSHFIMQRDEINQRARELKRQQALALAEKKRRMRFPGRYTKEFVKVVFANFRNNLKSYLLFIIAASWTVAFLYVITGAQSIIISLGEGRVEQGMNRSIGVLTSIIPMMLILSVMLLVLIISNYIKTRMRNYSIFIGLGIRKNTLWLIIAMEYSACIISSGIIGLILGNIVFPFLKSFYRNTMGVDAQITVPYGLVTLITCTAYLLITGFATLINYHLFEHVDISSAMVKSVKPDRLPSHFLILGLLIGLYYIITPFYRFSTGLWGESESLTVTLLIGCLFIVYCGGSKLLKRSLKHREHFFREFFKILPWRYRFRTNAKYWLLFFALNLFAVSVFVPRLSACLSAGSLEKLYPYDFVCLTQKNDDGFFQELEQDYNITLKTYPMVRINTALGKPYDLLQFLKISPVPIGQHIGISESVYQELKKRLPSEETQSLKLKGKEIHIVRQQDVSQPARPIDWSGSRETPHIKAGNTFGYGQDTLNASYPPYNIKSQEMASLIGMFDGGEYENIVVFTDSYFEELYKEVLEEQSISPSPTQLITLNADSRTYDDVSNALKQYLQEGTQNTDDTKSAFQYYTAGSALLAASGERFFKVLIYSIILCTLLICSLFIFYLKYSMEASDLKERNRLLEAVGLSPTALDRLMKKEMGVHSTWTYLAGLVFSAFFFLMIPVIRLFSAKEALLFYLVLGLLTALYTILYFIGIGRLESYFIYEQHR